MIVAKGALTKPTQALRIPASFPHHLGPRSKVWIQGRAISLSTQAPNRYVSQTYSALKTIFFFNVPALPPGSSAHGRIVLELLGELFSSICSFAK